MRKRCFIISVLCCLNPFLNFSTIGTPPHLCKSLNIQSHDGAMPSLHYEWYAAQNNRRKNGSFWVAQKFWRVAMCLTSCHLYGYSCLFGDRSSSITPTPSPRYPCLPCQGHQQLSGKSEEKSILNQTNERLLSILWIDLCFFSLDQWEIMIHLLWGKCFNIPQHALWPSFKLNQI